MLEKFGMKDCNGLQYPLDSNQDLFAAIDSKDKLAEVPYQELKGSLMYISQNNGPDMML